MILIITRKIIDRRQQDQDAILKKNIKTKTKISSHWKIIFGSAPAIRKKTCVFNVHTWKKDRIGILNLWNKILTQATMKHHSGVRHTLPKIASSSLHYHSKTNYASNK